MNNENLKIKEKQIDYNVLKKIQEHAKKYDSEPDKKNFLKSVCAYEQKFILLNSRKPCEVLMYLDELDSKSSRLVLNELTFQEVSKILQLFSTEDKELFYKTFSDLKLVNRFIEIDKNASNIIEDLSFKRKVELIDSSTPKTAEASSKIYESMTVEEKKTATEYIKEPEAINALNVSTTYEEDVEVLSSIKTEEIQENNEVSKQGDVQKFQEEIQQEEKEEDQKERKEEKIKQEEQNELKEEEPQQDEQKDDLNNNLSNTSEKEYDKNIDLLERYSIIEDGPKKVSIINNPSVLQQFDQAKKRCEQKDLYRIMEAKQEVADITSENINTR